MSSDMPSALLPESSEAYDLLLAARQHYTQKELARRLSVASKTVARWEHQENPCPVFLSAAIRELLLKFQSAPLSREEAKFTFIDLFAGIGGIRKGFESWKGQCVFTSEWNPWAKQTYQENFPGIEKFVGDIVPYPAEDIPKHDLLLAGFPCQPFSIAGVSKKNALGRPHGFECTTQGTLFFDVARIIAATKPKAFLLENVKNLVNHNGGNTFKVIRDVLQNELKYHIHWKVIDARYFVPQHRERLIIVGFQEQTDFTFDSLHIPAKRPVLASILHPEDGSEPAEEPYTTGPDAKVHSKYVLTGKLWDYLKAYAKKHREAGNGFGYGIVDKTKVARTLSARYYKDGSEILVSRGEGKNPRRLTPRECARLMGYPDSFRIPVSDTQAYKQFGNSVVVPVIAEVARIMMPHVLMLKQREEIGVGQAPLLV
ncbi:MAG TPA: DNA (cytosine-5-)-methyltransferase [Candidatus Angelobacter sp.]|jgi:DNA (cytosine-5)-methyltransferase 1